MQYDYTKQKIKATILQAHHRGRKMKILIVTWMAIANALVSASYVRNMHNDKTCVEAGYEDITSRSQCESAFRLVPKHPEKKLSSSHVSWCHYTPLL